MTTRSTRRGGRMLAVAVAVLVTLTGCTGVPTRSQPQVIKSLPGGGGLPALPITPSPGIPPRNLVLQFLKANALEGSGQSSARTFLTPAARSRWSDSTVTVLDAANVQPAAPGSSEIVVTGRVIGTVNASGSYLPSLLGSRGRVARFPYRVAKVNGEWRISSPQPGLLLTQEQFLQAYKQQSVYFFDLAHRYLVPDPRWTSISDPAPLAEYLLNELAGGPSPALQNAVSNDTLPAQAAAHRINVTVGKITKVDIPGTSQLDGDARNRLAAQLVAMVEEADRGATVEITDGGKPVRIPDAGGYEFRGPEFSEALQPSTATPSQAPLALYYLRRGYLVGRDGKRVVGAIGNGRYYLNSFAASRSTANRTLSIAAESNVGGVPTLLVGNQTDGLRPTAVKGVTSRPAFVPGRDEVWVAAGSRVDRVGLAGKTPAITAVGLPAGVAGGKIVAMRLSPEGSRIALAIAATGGGQRLFVGAVVRNGGLVRIDTLSQISQEGAVITDLAWVESRKLYAIGFQDSTRDARVYEVGVDGSVWHSFGIGELPDAPTSLTVAFNEHAWVTSGDSVWVQSGATIWQSPGPDSSTPGYDPAYLE